MTRISFILVSSAIALSTAACGSDKGEPIVPDAGIDAQNTTCSVTDPSTCPAGEKCSFLLPSMENTNPPSQNPSVCVPAGNAEEFAACEYVASDDPDFRIDATCGVGLQCLFGECRKFCADGPESCDTAGAQTCTQFTNVLADQAVESGVCQNQCDPLDQSSCQNDDVRVEGCFRKLYVNDAGNQLLDMDFACFGVPEEATQTAAGEPCFGPDDDPNACFLNGVPRGTAVLFSGPGVKGVVTPFCRVEEAYTGAPAGGRLKGDPTPASDARPGDCSLGNFQAGDAKWQCQGYDEMDFLFMQTGQPLDGASGIFAMINEINDMPSGVGICVDTTIEVTSDGVQVPLYPVATDFDIATFNADMGDGTFDAAVAGEPYDVCTTCLSTDRWIEVIDALVGGSAALLKSMRKRASHRVMTELPLAPGWKPTFSVQGKRL